MRPIDQTTGMYEELEQFAERTGMGWDAAKTLFRRIEILDEFRVFHQRVQHNGVIKFEAWVAAYHARKREYSNYYRWQWKPVMKARRVPQNKKQYEKAKADPVRWAKELERHRAIRAKRKADPIWQARKLDPQYVHKNKEARRRWKISEMHKLKSDPVKYAMYLEKERERAARKRDARIKRFGHVAP